MRNMRWLAALAAASLAVLLLFVRPIPQPQAYHRFADQRTLLAGIPSTLNVLSNAAFVVAGAIGLFVLRGPRAFRNAQERLDALTFFVGTLLTAAGSTYYHLRPDDARLVWDRAGMVVTFMAFLAMVIHERCDGARWLLPALMAIGAASLVWWRAFDDLRPYGWVQFFPMLAVLVLVVRERRYSGEIAALVWLLVAYGAAKLCEQFDAQIYAALNEAVSGHTLKHVLAALGPLIVAVWIARRAQVHGSSPDGP
jgi:hypothetical protein